MYRSFHLFLNPQGRLKLLLRLFLYYSLNDHFFQLPVKELILQKCLGLVEFLVDAVFFEEAKSLFRIQGILRSCRSLAETSFFTSRFISPNSRLIIDDVTVMRRCKRSVEVT